MAQYKTIYVETYTLKVKAKDMYTVATANKALSGITATIEKEAKDGWRVNSIINAPAMVIRKKGILEILLGWIPIIGVLFRSNKPDVEFPTYQAIIFEKD